MKQDRKSVPSRWILTDSRRLPVPDALSTDLPADIGLIFRHYEASDRVDLAHAFAEACRWRGMLFLVAADARLALETGADGLHVPDGLVPRRTLWRRRRPAWLITAAAHDAPAIDRARRAGIDAVFVSPTFETASHAGAPHLGPFAAGRLARTFPGPAIALGGMTEARFQRLKPLGFHGWAAIGAWTRPV